MEVLLAMVAACTFALGNAMQQRGALRTSAPGDSTRFLVQLFRHPVWVVGGALQIGGFVAQVGALAVGSLLVVQAIVVSSFVIALPCGAWLTDQRLGRREVLGALTTVAGLVLFLLGSDPTRGTNHVPTQWWVACLIVSAAVLGGLDIASRRSVRPRPLPCSALRQALPSVCKEARSRRWPMSKVGLSGS